MVACRFVIIGSGGSSSLPNLRRLLRRRGVEPWKISQPTSGESGCFYWFFVKREGSGEVCGVSPRNLDKEPQRFLCASCMGLSAWRSFFLALSLLGSSLHLHPQDQVLPEGTHVAQAPKAKAPESSDPSENKPLASLSQLPASTRKSSRAPRFSDPLLDPAPKISAEDGPVGVLMWLQEPSEDGMVWRLPFILWQRGLANLQEVKIEEHEWQGKGPEEREERTRRQRFQGHAVLRPNGSQEHRTPLEQNYTYKEACEPDSRHWPTKSFIFDALYCWGSTGFRWLGGDSEHDAAVQGLAAGRSQCSYRAPDQDCCSYDLSRAQTDPRPPEQSKSGPFWLLESTRQGRAVRCSVASLRGVAKGQLREAKGTICGPEGRSGNSSSFQAQAVGGSPTGDQRDHPSDHYTEQGGCRFGCSYGGNGCRDRHHALGHRHRDPRRGGTQRWRSWAAASSRRGFEAVWWTTYRLTTRQDEKDHGHEAGHLEHYMQDESDYEPHAPFQFVAAGDHRLHLWGFLAMSGLACFQFKKNGRISILDLLNDGTLFYYAVAVPSLVWKSILGIPEAGSWLRLFGVGEWNYVADVFTGMLAGIGYFVYFSKVIFNYARETFAMILVQYVSNKDEMLSDACYMTFSIGLVLGLFLIFLKGYRLLVQGYLVFKNFPAGRRQGQAHIIQGVRCNVRGRLSTPLSWKSLVGFLFLICGGEAISIANCAQVASSQLSGKVNCSIGDPYRPPTGWMGPEEDVPPEPPEPPMVVLMNFGSFEEERPHVQLSSTSSTEAPEVINMVMFGSDGRPLGRRDASLHLLTNEEIKAAVRRAWQDYPFATFHVYSVRPVPDRLQGQGWITVVDLILPGHRRLPGTLTLKETHVFRRSPAFLHEVQQFEAFRFSTPSTIARLIAEAGLSDRCDTRRHGSCSVLKSGQILLLGIRHDILAGEHILFLIDEAHPAPPDVIHFEEPQTFVQHIQTALYGSGVRQYLTVLLHGFRGQYLGTRIYGAHRQRLEDLQVFAGDIMSIWSEEDFNSVEVHGVQPQLLARDSDGAINFHFLVAFTPPARPALVLHRPFEEGYGEFDIVEMPALASFGRIVDASSWHVSHPAGHLGSRPLQPADLLDLEHAMFISIEGPEFDDEGVGLLQLRSVILPWAASDAVHGRTVGHNGFAKLPPPGNGGGQRHVQFSSQLWVVDDCQESVYNITTENCFMMEVTKALQCALEPAINSFQRDFQFHCGVHPIAVTNENPFVEEFNSSLRIATFINPFVDLLREDDYGKETDDHSEVLHLMDHLPAETKDQEVHHEYLRIAQLLSERVVPPKGPLSTSGSEKDGGIDFRGVFATWLWLEHHFISPNYLLPEDVSWHENSWPWLSWDWWLEEPAVELHFYTDGSRKDAQSGLATTLFVKIWTGEWKFGGHRAMSLCEGSSYFAELAALLLTYKWLYDLLRHVGGHPACYVHFDSTSAGFRATGAWQGTAFTSLVTSVRSLDHLIRERFGCSLQGSHVRAHCGHPGNEIANSLAYYAASSSVENLDSVLHSLAQGDRDCEMPWLHFLFKKELLDCWHMGFLHLPASATSAPQMPDEIAVVTEDSIQDLATLVFHHHLKVTSANVLTLLPGTQTEAGFLDTARQEAILKQAAASQIGVLSLQETRLRRTGLRATTSFWILQAAAVRGQGGIALCFNRLLPYAKCGEKNYFFQKEHFSILVATHRLMIVKVNSPGLKILVAGLHAPQSGQDEAVLREWWTNLHNSIPSKYKDWALIVAGDFNARIGDEPTLATGGYQGEEPNLNGQLMQEWLIQMSLWAPSTWESCQVGPPGTWQHPGTGKWSRLDYICIPHGFKCSEAKVDLDIDLSLKRNDHLAVSALLDFTMVDRSHQSQVWRTRPMVETSELREHLQALPPLLFTRPPTLDVHTHAWQLTEEIKMHCAYKARKVLQPRKTAMSPSTWELVQEKRHFRNEMLWWQRDADRETLRAFFHSWKGNPLDRDCYVGKLRLCRHFTALAWFHFRQLGRLVTKAVREDTKRFLEGLASRQGDLDDGRFTKQLWQELRKHFPAMKKRRAGFAPFQLEVLDDQWVPHFSQLEAGRVIEPQEHLDACHRRQTEALATKQLSLTLEELPNIVEVEQVLRRTQPNRAPGPEGLLPGYLHWAAPQFASAVHMLYCKVFVQEAEPFPFKGGTMIPIHKRSSPLVADNYRGIVLLPVLAKALQALLRRKIVAALSVDRPPGLMGGFPCQRVTYGSHSTRSFTALAAAHNFSTAILYIDLKHAYHHLIRGLSLGCNADDADFEASLSALKDVRLQDACRRSLAEDGPLKSALEGQAVLGLLREIHCDTFFNVKGTHVRTARGSRPGSPLADMMFAGLTSKLHREFDALLKEDVEIQRATAAMGTPAVTVTWADDITLEVVATQAEELIPTLQRIAGVAFQRIQAHGLTLNLTPGKTSAVLAFRGPGAPALRKRYLQEEKLCDVTLLDVTVQLPLLCAYPHLGVKATASGSLDHEIRARIGMARSAFLSIRKQIIGSRRLSHHTRCKLVNSLLLSKLYFGCGAWELLPFKMQKKLDGFVALLFREALDEQFWREEKLTDERIFAKHLLLTPRVRIARDRLLYAASLVRDGPDYLWPRLLALHDKTPLTSWIAGLSSDLEWLATILPDVKTAPWNATWATRAAYWRADRIGWGKLVKFACRVHLAQEQTISDVRWWHNLMLQDLARHGAVLQGFDTMNLGSDEFGGFCGMKFQTKRGLWVHQRHRHGRKSLEYHVADGSVCPVCLKDFWSTARLRQHLAYAPRDGSCNVCYQQLIDAGHFVAQPSVVHPSNSLHGINRLDAVQLPGPSPGPLTLQVAYRRNLQAELEEVEEQLAVLGFPRHKDAAAWNLVHEELNKVSSLWYDDWFHRGPHGGIDDLQGAWIGVLTARPALEKEATFIFMEWSDDYTEALFAEWGDSRAAHIVEQQAASFIGELEGSALMRKRTSLQLRITRLAAPPPPRLPHRPVNKQPANKQERATRDASVPGFYSKQATWRDEQLQMAFLKQPDMKAAVPTINELGERPLFIVIHLFSGRRRANDFHDHLLRLCEADSFQVIILSMDTAVSLEHGDLRAHARPWRILQRWLATGRVAACIAGSPCETFTEARYHPVVDAEGNVKEGPRVLRTAKELWGLAGLTLRELRQLAQGSGFALQVLWCATLMALWGGVMVSEHPAVPRDPERASIWTSPMVTLLRCLPQVCLHQLSQWEWGATTPKPTGFLAINAPSFRKSMARWKVPEAKKPEACRMGVDSEGRYLTSPMKEYPPALCGGLAQCIHDQLKVQHRSGRLRGHTLDADDASWMRAMASLSERIDPAQQMRQDWQDLEIWELCKPVYRFRTFGLGLCMQYNWSCKEEILLWCVKWKKIVKRVSPVIQVVIQVVKMLARDFTEKLGGVIPGPEKLWIWYHDI